MKRLIFRRLATITMVFMLILAITGGLVSAAPVSQEQTGWKGIVQFESGTSPSLKSALVHGFGGAVEKDLPALEMAIVNLPNAAAANGLAKAKGVLQVEADSIRTFCDDTLPWGIDRIDADIVWKPSIPTTQGAGVNVAVLDTGIDSDHPDLVGNLRGAYSCVNTDTTYVEDLNGHGTHCSGIIAAMDNNTGVIGVGPAINLYMVQISKKSTINLTDIVEGINWCVSTYDDEDVTNNIDVMSMSFGGGYSSSEASAINVAYARGIVLVAAAGNESSSNVIYPAALDNVIAVSAVDSNDQIAYFSNYGPKIDLAAPGVSILSTYLRGGYATMSGTSMACPHVAGAAAMVIASGISDANGNGLINDEVIARLKDTAEDIELTSDYQGAGLVDVEKAVMPTTPPLPVDSGTISGTVKDSSSAPIPGATVSVVGSSFSTSVNTNSDGTYLISNVPVGNYTVSASMSGYVSMDIANVAVTLNTTSTVDFQLDLNPPQELKSMQVASIDFSSKKAGKNLFLYATVKMETTSDNPTPVSGALVNLTFENDSVNWSFSGITASDGTIKFTLAKAEPGNYTATVTDVSLDGYECTGLPFYDSCNLGADGSIS